MRAEPHKICLRPDCQATSNRLVSQEEIPAHLGCEKWLCNLDEPFEDIKSRKIILSNPIKICFKDSPLGPIRELLSMSKWSEKVE